jgi:hypothetical protein
MGLAGRYFQARASVENKTVLLYFEGQLSLKDEEELP